MKARYGARWASHPAGRAKYLAALADLERLRPPDPVPERPLAEARPISQGLPVATPRASPQLAAVLEAAQALARGRVDAGTPEDLARRAMTALGDPGADPAATAALWADALRLMPDRMTAWLRAAPRKRRPAPWLSSVLGRALPAARSYAAAAEGRAERPRPGPTFQGPTRPGSRGTFDHA